MTLMLGSDATPPTVVLVHGAFADQSYWHAIAWRLEAHGVRAVIRPNPLSGLAADAEYTARGVGRLRGPVLLVGHSYGGAVISVAAEAADNVIGLVYVAGFILEVGEAFAGAASDRRGTPCRVAAGAPPQRRGCAPLRLVPPEPLPHLTTQVEPELLLQPHGASIFDERPRAAAWKRLPSWAIVATADQAIDAAHQRRMAMRSRAETIDVDGSHDIGVSHPGSVADVILRAAAATTATSVAA